MSSFCSAIFAHKFVFWSYLFCISVGKLACFNKPDAATLFKKETLNQVFSCEFCTIYNNNSFLEHLWMVASETGTENNVGNSARCKEFSSRDEKFILKSTHVKSFIYLFICLFIYLFVCLFVCLFIYLFIYLLFFNTVN